MNLNVRSALCKRLLAQLTFLTADVAAPGLVGLELLTNDGEVGLVSGQAQHDEIGVCATQTVLRVGIVIRLSCNITVVLLLLLTGCRGTRN